MSEMVERVGAALRKACLKEYGTNWGNDVAWRFARAALVAMREPTEGMKTIGDRASLRYGAHDCEVPMSDVWRAMIDEALK
jgi:hypothetical protein